MEDRRGSSTRVRAWASRLGGRGRFSPGHVAVDMEPLVVPLLEVGARLVIPARLQPDVGDPDDAVAAVETLGLLVGDSLSHALPLPWGSTQC